MNSRHWGRMNRSVQAWRTRGVLNFFSVVVVVLDDVFFVSFREVFWGCVCLMFFLFVFWG